LFAALRSPDARQSRLVVNCNPKYERPIDVDKSSSHHLSRAEIGGDNPCSRQFSVLGGKMRVRTPFLILL
jgi:hypothetical protein